MPLTTKSKISKGAVKIGAPPNLNPHDLNAMLVGWYFEIPANWGSTYPIVKDLDDMFPYDYFKVVEVKSGSRYIERMRDEYGRTIEELGPPAPPPPFTPIEI